jgi:hypothetical protein
VAEVCSFITYQLRRTVDILHVVAKAVEREFQILVRHILCFVCNGLGVICVIFVTNLTLLYGSRG